MLLGLSFLLLSGISWATSPALFSGRLSRLNEEASLMRFKVDFNNQKFLNKRDKVQFWLESKPSIQCKGFIVGKSNDYLLVKVPSYNFCQKYLGISLGGHVLFSSVDLGRNIETAQELMDVLIRKSLALTGRLKRHEKELHAHVEKVNAVNERYRVLRERLEHEWRKEISKLEDDNATIKLNYRNLQSRLDEVDFKMQQYRIEDENLVEDRWSLDPRLYYKK
jgi:hypothetical protein